MRFLSVLPLKKIFERFGNPLCVRQGGANGANLRQKLTTPDIADGIATRCRQTAYRHTTHTSQRSLTYVKLNMFSYLSRIEDPPPKRTAARSNRAGNANSGGCAMRRNRKRAHARCALFPLLPFACRPLLLPHRDNEICSTPLALLTAFTLRFARDESRRERYKKTRKFSAYFYCKRSPQLPHPVRK